MKVTDRGVPVDELIRVVKDSVQAAGVSRTSQNRDLQVTSVRLILEVVASKTAGGRLDFRVPFIGMRLRVGGMVTKKDTHTIDMTLVPKEERAVRGGDIEEVLVNAIETIREVMASAAAGKDPLGSLGEHDRHFLRHHGNRNDLARGRGGAGQRGNPNPPPRAGPRPRLTPPSRAPSRSGSVSGRRPTAARPRRRECRRGSRRGGRHHCRCWPAGAARHDEGGSEGGDAEPARKEEGPAKSCSERGRRGRTGAFQGMGCALATVARTARPSEPPTWRAVLTRPEAKPASERPTPNVAAAASGGKSTPREKAMMTPGPKTALQ